MFTFVTPPNTNANEYTIMAASHSGGGYCNRNNNNTDSNAPDNVRTTSTFTIIEVDSGAVGEIMSELKINKVEPLTPTGTTVIGKSGDTITIPSGATVTNSGTAFKLCSKRYSKSFKRYLLWKS